VSPLGDFLAREQHPPAKYLCFKRLAWLSSLSAREFFARAGCPAIYEVGRAQKTQASEDFPAGENRAVREGTRQDRRK
jgi:hypothetical protein